MMRKSCRSRVRTRGQRVLTVETRMVALFDYVQTSTDWRTWTKRTVSAQSAAAMAGRGEAEKITRHVGEGVMMLVGYRRTQPVRLSRPSPATLTHATMVAVGKRAQRCHLTRGERRHIEKFVMWPEIGDTKAVAVRPRISKQDQRRIDALVLTGSLEMAEVMAAA